jgi:hypothetical protein
MTTRIRLIYLATLVLLVIVGLLFNLPAWGAALLGVAVMTPVAIADLVISRRSVTRG